MATLYDPDVFCSSAAAPRAVLLIPVTFRRNAPKPSDVFQFSIVTAFSAKSPTPVFPSPVVIELPAFGPTNTLYNPAAIFCADKKDTQKINNRYNEDNCFILLLDNRRHAIRRIRHKKIFCQESF